MKAYKLENKIKTSLKKSVKFRPGGVLNLNLYKIEKSWDQEFAGNFLFYFPLNTYKLGTQSA